MAIGRRSKLRYRSSRSTVAVADEERLSLAIDPLQRRDRCRGRRRDNPACNQHRRIRTKAPSCIVCTVVYCMYCAVLYVLWRIVWSVLCVMPRLSVASVNQESRPRRTTSPMPSRRRQYLAGAHVPLAAGRAGLGQLFQPSNVTGDIQQY